VQSAHRAAFLRSLRDLANSGVPIKARELETRALLGRGQGGTSTREGGHSIAAVSGEELAAGAGGTALMAVFHKVVDLAHYRRFIFPQSSSNSRCTAGESGFLNLSQSRERPET
jgi:hypothetical protein